MPVEVTRRQPSGHVALIHDWLREGVIGPAAHALATWNISNAFGGEPEHQFEEVFGTEARIMGRAVTEEDVMEDEALKAVRRA